MDFDVIIIGGGAAGLFCAIEAGKRGRSVLVLEHNDRVGKKIAISGGGRCNFTNTNTRPENFLSQNPHFCRSALARFTPSHFIELVEKHGIPYHEKKLGQLFCDGSSREIIQMLLSECEAANVKIFINSRVKRVAFSNAFEVEVNDRVLEGESLVIAAGGLSIPTIGATSFGYDVAKQFGLNIIEPRPGLVPLAYDDSDGLGELSGISIDTSVSLGRARFRENTLLTHRGMSGPAILQISSYWQPGEVININLLPEANAADLLDEANSGTDLVAILSRFLPRRFALWWCAANAPDKPLNQYSKRERAEVAEQLNNWQMVFNRTEGFRKAEVTLGGVDSNELSSKTMEARRVPGLYFIGEVVDVTGWLGGYNFQWAWASGFAAGQYV
jgi:predicted Rossmann fold flavoprotein